MCAEAVVTLPLAKHGAPAVEAFLEFLYGRPPAALDLDGAAGVLALAHEFDAPAPLAFATKALDALIAATQQTVLVLLRIQQLADTFKLDAVAAKCVLVFAERLGKSKSSRDEPQIESLAPATLAKLLRLMPLAPVLPPKCACPPSPYNIVPAVWRCSRCNSPLPSLSSS